MTAPALPDKALCPMCFRQYSAAQLRSEWPLCADCSGEAMDIGLESLRKWLAGTTARELVAIRRRWAADAKSFLPAYHREKLLRIDRLIEAKKRLSAERTGKRRKRVG